MKLIFLLEKKNARETGDDLESVQYTGCNRSERLQTAGDIVGIGDVGVLLAEIGVMSCLRPVGTAVRRDQHVEPRLHAARGGRAADDQHVGIDPGQQRPRVEPKKDGAAFFSMISP